MLVSNPSIPLPLLSGVWDRLGASNLNLLPQEGVGVPALRVHVTALTCEHSKLPQAPPRHTFPPPPAKKEHAGLVSTCVPDLRLNLKLLLICSGKGCRQPVAAAQRAEPAEQPCPSPSPAEKLLRGVW